MSGVGAWIRYGDPMTAEQIDFAAQHYRAAILQPWELDAARELKSRRPDMTLLCYKCLSSTRDYEPGPIYSSGVSFAEAERGLRVVRPAAGWEAGRVGPLSRTLADESVGSGVPLTVGGQRHCRARGLAF